MFKNRKGKPPLIRKKIGSPQRKEQIEIIAGTWEWNLTEACHPV